MLVPYDGEACILSALVVHVPDKKGVLLGKWVFNFLFILFHLLLIVIIDILVVATVVVAVWVLWRSVRILRGAKIAEQIFFVHRLA